MTMLVAQIFRGNEDVQVLGCTWYRSSAVYGMQSATASRVQLSVPKVLRVARLFQELPQLKELKLAVPAAVLFAAVRFW